MQFGLVERQRQHRFITLVATRLALMTQAPLPRQPPSDLHAQGSIQDSRRGERSSVPEQQGVTTVSGSRVGARRLTFLTTPLITLLMQIMPMPKPRFRIVPPMPSLCGSHGPRGSREGGSVASSLLATTVIIIRRLIIIISIRRRSVSSLRAGGPLLSITSVTVVVRSASLLVWRRRALLIIITTLIMVIAIRARRSRRPPATRLREWPRARRTKGIRVPASPLELLLRAARLATRHGRRALLSNARRLLACVVHAAFQHERNAAGACARYA